jgi:hypothetical protein
MKLVILPLLLTLVAGELSAEEVRLICTGVHSGTRSVPSGQRTNPVTGLPEQQYASVPYETELVREIRFDESTNDFRLKGSAAIGNKTDDEEWVTAKRVVFTQASIEVEFDRSRLGRARNILSFGLAQAVEGKPIGILDRYSGVWRMMGQQLSCQKLDTSERKF